MQSNQSDAFIEKIQWEDTKWTHNFKVQKNKITLVNFDSSSLVSKDPIPRDRPISITFTMLESKGYPMWFGITSAAHKFEKSIQFGNDIVYYYSADGRKRQGFVSLNGQEHNSNAGLALKDGHQVTMTIDSKNHEISWNKNGQPLGVNNFAALQEKDFYIFIQMWKDNTTIQLS